MLKFAFSFPNPDIEVIHVECTTCGHRSSQTVDLTKQGELKTRAEEELIETCLRNFILGFDSIQNAIDKVKKERTKK